MASNLKTWAPEISLRRRINALAKKLTYIVLIYLGLSITYSVGTLYLSGELQNAALIAEDIAEVSLLH
jgi:hypothetical protein